MFIWKTRVIHENIFLACQSSTDTLTRFKDSGLSPALSKMERGRKPSDSPTDNDHVVLFIHHDNYIELSKGHHLRYS